MELTCFKRAKSKLSSFVCLSFPFSCHSSMCTRLRRGCCALQGRAWSHRHTDCLLYDEALSHDGIGVHRMAAHRSPRLRDWTSAGIVHPRSILFLRHKNTHTHTHPERKRKDREREREKKRERQGQRKLIERGQQLGRNKITFFHRL